MGTAPIPISCTGGSGVIPGFGQGGRDVFALNVPHCECLGRPSAPFGLGWISQGGEEMGQSSTHILRQFRAGLLGNANAFFYPFSALQVIGFAQSPVSLGRRLLQLLQLLQLLRFVLLTWGQVPPPPASFRNASGGEQPKGSDKKGRERRELLTRHHERQQGSVFFPEVMSEAHPWFLRAWERAGNAALMLLVEPAASGCESRLAGPGPGTFWDPPSPAPS